MGSNDWENRPPAGPPEERWELKCQEARVVVPRTVVLPALNDLLTSANFVLKNYMEQLKDKGQKLDSRDIHALMQAVKGMGETYRLGKEIEKDEGLDKLSEGELMARLKAEFAKEDKDDV